MSKIPSFVVKNKDYLNELPEWDVYYRQGDYVTAREYYGKLPNTIENIVKIFDTLGLILRS